MALAPWNDSMSDGCSVPSFLRFIVKKETLDETKVCVLHDKAYYYGGSAEDRERADEALRVGLIKAGMPRALAFVYWLGVRIFGHPDWRFTKRSWANGNQCFAYTAKPNC